MVKLLKIFSYAIFFILGLLYFIPKSSLYYYSEQELQKQQIIISNEDIVEKSLTLKLENADVYYQNIKGAHIENSSISIFFLYNKLELNGIKLSHILSSTIPLNIDNMHLQYTILNPLKITAEATGEFGKAEANLDILDNNLTVMLKPSKLMIKEYKNTLKYFRKNRSGEYEYAKTF